MADGAGIRPYPPAYWDEQASSWEAVVRNPQNPHQFYYYEADLCISAALGKEMQVLELGCGTGGSTRTHAGEVARLVAIDFSRKMIREARKTSRDYRDGTAEFAVADASRLPFAPSSFDALISRGVLVSYAADPATLLAEARRVLRPAGKIALDAMNRSSRRGVIGRSFTLAGKNPAYMEFYNRGGRQVREYFLLKPGSKYASFAREGRKCTRRPRDLQREVVSVTRYDAWLFRPLELVRLAEQAGFRDVRITPLGHLARLLQTQDPGLRRFLRRNRKRLSQLALSLAGHWRPETALHLFITATRT